MDLDLSGRCALIAGRGDGLPVAEALARRGCALHLSAADDPTLHVAAARLSEDYGVEVEVHSADLTESVNAEVLALECEDADILINVPGALPSGAIEKIDSATWQRMWQQELFGMICLTREVYETMADKGRGTIINFIGIAGHLPDGDNICDATGSAALAMLTRSLGKVSTASGVRVAGLFVDGQGSRQAELAETAVLMISNAEISGKVLTLDQWANSPGFRSYTNENDDLTDNL